MQWWREENAEKTPHFLCRLILTQLSSTQLSQDQDLQVFCPCFSSLCAAGRYWSPHKVLTYIEYRSVSGVFRTIDPPSPLQPASVSSPRTKGWGVHTRRAVRGWGVNISEDARHWIGLLQYNPSKGLHMQADGRRGISNETTTTKIVGFIQYLIPSKNGGNGAVLVLFKASFLEHL
jgi:hypothetical protein